MKEKLLKAKEELLRQVRNISISITVAVHLIYIGYLAYSLKQDIGIKEVNIALIVGTAVFLVAYLFLQIVTDNRKSRLKTTKKFYKRFKLVTKVFTTGTAVYSLVTAAKAVSPFAMILSVLGAIFLAVRVITELLVALISSQARKIKESFKSKRESKKMQKLVEEMEIAEEASTLYEEDLK